MPGEPSEKHTDWGRVYEDYVKQNMDPTRQTPYTLRDVAQTWDLAYGTVRNKAAKESWREKLREARQHRAAVAVAEVQQRLAQDEVEVRERQGKMFEQLEAVIWNKIVEGGGIDISKLSEKQKVEVLLMVAEARREALGIGKVATPAVNVGIKMGEGTVEFRWTEEMDRDFEQFLDTATIDVTPESTDGIGEPDTDESDGADPLP